MTPFADRSSYIVDPKLPKLILEELTNQVKALTYTECTVGFNKIDESLRTSTLAWLPWDTWIAGIMHNLFISANNHFYNYDLDHFDSGIQATKYEPDQFFGWHVDQSVTTYKPRKLSMSLVLDTEFEGGELQIFNPRTHKIDSHDLKPGQVCIFPSWASHQVTPVTSGTRYSLVTWMNGPEFR